jgi:mono/diheme cytochrome c family protein
MALLKPIGHALLTCIALFSVAIVARAESAVRYNRDVRPILAENCFSCHGPDSASRKADLRLDRREAAITAEAIKPGQPDASDLIKRILSSDPDEMMPPPATHKVLKKEQKETLKRWIAAGAEYEPHWSLLAPQRPELPTVKNEAWIRNPIDRFILARLEQAGLQPAPEADRRTLARRLSLDLTGLPPAPEDVDQFVNDSSPDAYERYVDRLLELPQWGEHRGRYWLDAARYGDTHGIHIDNYREMWAYRDWVIDAFNRNVPFDRFTIEQLAGDLLPNATLEQRIASGFNRCNITTSEGGAIAEEYLVLYDRDRTETTSLVWMGLTAGCAVCHDHKFDPLSQREFYELAAFFNNTTQAGMDGNVKDTPPVVFVPTPQDRPRWEALSAEMTGVRRQMDDRKQSARPDFTKWTAEASPEQVAAMVPTDGLRLQALLGEGSGNTVNMTVDGQPRSLSSETLVWDKGHVAGQSFKSQPGAALEIAEAGDFEKDQAFSAAAWVKLTKGGQTGAVFARMDDRQPGEYRGWDLWIENGRVGSHIIHHFNNKDAIKVMTKGTVKLDQWNHLLLTYDGSGKGAGVKIFVNGIPETLTVSLNGLKNSIRTEVPFRIAQRHSSSHLNDALIQDVRIYGRALAGAEATQLAKVTRAAWLIAKPALDRTKPETEELFAWWLSAVDPPTQELSGRLSSMEQEETAMKARGAVSHVMNEKPEMPMAFVLFRGEYDKRRDQVTAHTPACLPPMADGLPPNRLGLAQWLLQPEHPLTARVTVNRFWQEVFGAGLVRTAGDFGVSGELPTHPELLDWLAVQFRESGWDMKKFFKLLVTSATYRQSAQLTEAKLEKDSQNRLLSRGPRFRMDGEMVRDYALAASGLLVRNIGGPSVRPYQPPGVWEAVAMPGSTTRTYVQDHGDGLYRRSMYTLWKRAAPPASMEIFNAPSREVCTVRRERTNTPLQALVTLNDPQFVEAARYLAERTLTDGGEQSEARVDFLARRLLARSLRAEEAPIVQAGLNDLLTYYQAHADEAKQLIEVGEVKADAKLDVPSLAAWTMLANELFNLDEVLNK